MLSDYERRVLAEFESDFRHADAQRRARRTRAASYSRLAVACVLMLSALMLAAVAPLPTAATAVLVAVVGPLGGLTLTEALRGPRVKTRAGIAHGSSTRD
jgi:Protein of unknown function (DUF3040)